MGTMIDKIQARIDELTNDIQELTTVREQLVNSIRDIDIRLTQIMGAVSELKTLLIDPVKNEKDQIE
jgi:methyl-accepting chemotaxis protein